MAKLVLETPKRRSGEKFRYVDMDKHVDFGIALDIGLHVEAITPEVIENSSKTSTTICNLTITFFILFQNGGEEADH